jgi:hypothetical protein
MSANPVLDLYRHAISCGSAPTNQQLADAFAAFTDPNERSMYGSSRSAVIAEFGFGLPTAEVIAKIAEHGPILEIGAGSGLWSFFLAKAGCDVVAVDLATDDYQLGLGIGRHHQVIRMDAVEAIQAYPDRSVLMVWPDRKNDVSECVADEIDVGQTLIYMGENICGLMGTQGFFERLKESFAALDKAWPPVWHSVADGLTIFRKERKCAQTMSLC